MIKGPIAVLIVGGQGTGKSQIVDILVTALSANAEALITMGCKETIPQIHFIDSDGQTSGPEDAEISIHILQVEQLKPIVALLKLGNII